MKIQFHRIDTNVVVGLLVREFCCSGTDVSAKVLAMYADTRTPSMEPQWLAAGLSQRVGGDEFVIRLHNATEQDAKECMQRVREALSAADKKTDIPISAAMGYAWSDDPDKDTEKLLQSADAQMYENKQMMKIGKI